MKTVNSFNEEVFNEVPENIKIKVEDILKKTNLYWDIKQEDLISINGLSTPNTGTFRSDNDVWLGTVSKKYKPLQNSELTLTILTAAEVLNLEIVSGGFNYTGNRVYLNLKLEDKYIGDTKIRRFITAINNHDGHGSVNFGSYYVIEEMDKNGQIQTTNFFKLNSYNAKFRHSSNVKQKINIAVKNLFSSLQEDEEVMNNFALMQKIKIDDDLLKSVILKCYGVNSSDPNAKVSTRSFNKLKQVDLIVANEINKNEKSAWGLFNGILKSTETLNPKNINAKDYYMAGKGAKINMKAYDIIMNFIK